eukprot:CAMPEP_0180165678 /NCGR_PEP_ID=MMETSP0986-20121125/31112_1 /TAXON_ID=697907 /ORGANISM="non described non described, Strain CCMP2293" /LENGTH=131 /DNA_ID=CAMNT_0022116699 /DNA_START=379 /DNA_END=770 /DNA_ORIENTATION=+
MSPPRGSPAFLSLNKLGFFRFPSSGFLLFFGATSSPPRLVRARIPASEAQRVVRRKGQKVVAERGCFQRRITPSYFSKRSWAQVEALRAPPDRATLDGAEDPSFPRRVDHRGVRWDDGAAQEADREEEGHG